MKTYNFWRSWKNKTPRENAAIKSLKGGVKIILANISRKKILAIYVGGSFIRREMNEKSDVDTWTIVSQDILLKTVQRLEQSYRDKFKPHVGFSGYSINELRTGEKSSQIKELRPSPKRFVKMVYHYKLVYGKQLQLDEFPEMSDIKALGNLIKMFEDNFFPSYYKKEFGFQDIVKQVFWLTYLELRIKGKRPPYEWRKLIKLVSKKHIAHTALKLRKLRPKDKKIRNAFIKRLKEYLKQLSKLKQ